MFGTVRQGIRIALFLVMAAAGSNAQVINPVDIFQITQFSGTLNSVNLFLNGVGTMPTGAISITLNGSQPATLTLNSSTGIMTTTFGVNIDMPLFHTFNVPPDTLSFTESGPYTPNASGFVLSSNLSGGGGPSAEFGVMIAAPSNSWGATVATSGTWTSNFTLTFPASSVFNPASVQVLQTQGSGSFAATPVPEPSTAMLTSAAFFLFAIGCALALKRRGPRVFLS